jgi:hypothetical protein
LHLIEGAVKYYFQNFEIIMEKYILPEANIYSVDEMGIYSVKKCRHILGLKGQKQVGTAIFWKCGKNVTTVCAVSGSGNYIPPIIIYHVVSSLQTIFQTFKEEACIIIARQLQKPYFTLNLINCCRDNGIIMVSFLPHCNLLT